MLEYVPLEASVSIYRHMYVCVCVYIYNIIDCIYAFGKHWWAPIQRGGRLALPFRMVVEYVCRM